MHGGGGGAARCVYVQGVGRYDKSKPNQIMLHSVKPDEVEPKRAGFR